MSKQVIIYDEVDTEEELAELLREVARLIDSGMTSGHYPGWEIVENE
jgi:hypothetical protein